MIKAGPFGVSSADVALAYAVISPAKPGHFYSELYDGYNGQGPPSPHLTDYSGTYLYAYFFHGTT